MLRNDAVFWGWITDALRMAGVAPPAGRVVEFGSGMGLLDDVLDATTTSLVMLDHTDAYIQQRVRPLSARCTHLLWGPDTLDELQRTEAGSFDWVMSIAAFYHLDTSTAAALIRELAMLLRPGGHVLIEGWNPATPEQVRALSSRDRLFSRYPNYPLDVDLLTAALAPELEERWRDGILLYRKRGPEIIGERDGSIVRIAEYDEAWPARFEVERERIAGALGGIARRIDHVGSTSVPGLAAKPIVDISVGVDDPDDDGAFTDALTAAGYELRVVEPQHRMFRTPERDVQVHVWPSGGVEQVGQLLFRDWLRRSADDRARYETVKRTLAAQRWDDSNDYAIAKTDVVTEILARAEAWAAGSGWSP